MLKGFAITPPVIGRISIGRVIEKNGKRLPEKSDEFQVTTQVQGRDGWVLHPFDEALRQANGGGKLRAIPVRVLFNDPDLNLRAEYSLFDRETGRPACVGNGESCKRVTNDGIASLPCPSPDGCSYSNGYCRPYGRFNVVIGDEDELGSFIFRTTSFNSIRTLAARLRYFSAVSGGLLACMVALKGDKEIGDKLNKIISRLAEANELKGVIDVADFNDAEKLGKGKEMVDRLSNLVAIFDTPGLDFKSNRAEGDDILGDAYEYLMRHFATESGKSKGQFYTPAEVSRIMATETHRQIKISGLTVDIVRKDIKNLHLGVYPPNGRVRVAAPLAVTNDAVRLAVIGKLGWIKRQQAKFEAQPRQSPREMVGGESHYFQGRRYRIRVVEHKGAGTVVLRNKTTLEIHEMATLENLFKTRFTRLVDSHVVDIHTTCVPIDSCCPLSRLQ